MDAGGHGGFQGSRLPELLPALKTTTRLGWQFSLCASVLCTAPHHVPLPCSRLPHPVTPALRHRAPARERLPGPDTGPGPQGREQAPRVRASRVWVGEGGEVPWGRAVTSAGSLGAATAIGLCGWAVVTRAGGPCPSRVGVARETWRPRPLTVQQGWRLLSHLLGPVMSVWKRNSGTCYQVSKTKSANMAPLRRQSPRAAPRYCLHGSLSSSSHWRTTQPLGSGLSGSSSLQIPLRRTGASCSKEPRSAWRDEGKRHTRVGSPPV